MPRRQHQRLLGSLRGSGELRVGDRTYSVSYELDCFEDTAGQRTNGSVSGDVQDLLASGEDSSAILVLQDGSEISVLVSNAGADGADVEAIGALLQR